MAKAKSAEKRTSQKKPGKLRRTRASAAERISGLDHEFSNAALLKLALTHRSISYENSPEALADPGADNEQLEFVGDAVLGLIVAESLYRRFPASREGELTRLRSSLVGGRHLTTVATRIHLGRFLHLGKGEEASGGRSKPALLANALEAVIAAIYLDGGIDAARTFIESVIVEPALPELTQAIARTPASVHRFSGVVGDFKSALQEHLQATGRGQPEYALVDEVGPDHQKSFRIEVRIQIPDAETGLPYTALSEATGTTKKQAQQDAARLAYEHLLAQPAEVPAPAPEPAPMPVLPRSKKARRGAAIA